MDLSRLLSDIVKKLDLSLGFLWFLCQMEQEAGEARAGNLGESGAGAGPAQGALCGQVSVRGRMEQRCQHWCPEGLEDAWGGRQSCQNGAFYFATEVGYMERWNILAEPIPKNANAKTVGELSWKPSWQPWQHTRSTRDGACKF